MLNKEEQVIYDRAMKLAESDDLNNEKCQEEALPTIWTLMLPVFDDDGNPPDTTKRLLNAYRNFTEEQKAAVNEFIHITTGDTFMAWMDVWTKVRQDEQWSDKVRQRMQEL